MTNPQLILVARLYDDAQNRVYEVGEDIDSGALYQRLAGNRSRKWSAIHPTLNPDLETYLTRISMNFGWRTEVVK